MTKASIAADMTLTKKYLPPRPTSTEAAGEKIAKLFNMLWSCNQVLNVSFPTRWCLAHSFSRLQELLGCGWLEVQAQGTRRWRLVAASQAEGPVRALERGGDDAAELPASEERR